jgi:hypothetical protein
MMQAMYHDLNAARELIIRALGYNDKPRVLTPQEYRQVHDLWDLVAEAAYRLSEELDAQDEVPARPQDSQGSF